MMNNFPSKGRVCTRRYATLCKYVASIFLSIIALSAWSQDNQVTGKVKDANGGMPGVSIAVKGTQRGANTDVDGNYKIAVPANATLVFSYVGYKTLEVAVSGRDVVNVTLEEDNQVLNEVVVIGYGTVKKKDATGAVNAIGVKDFNKGVITSTQQLLQGRVAGVAITQNNGEPGGGINVRIRGTSSVRGGNGPLL
ncbi:MAG: carboxypeptidase-like regulatory domain-containing protein [Spirosomataceae bacterium]